MKTERIIGAFLFPEALTDIGQFQSLAAALRDFGINAIMTEAERYEPAAIDAAHALGLRFFAGIACFSDHATNFDKLAARPELWPILETGLRRAQMEWYIGITPTDRRHREEMLATIGSIAARYPIDGLFLDFIRWPLHWEIELRPGRPRPPDSSFDAATLESFEEETGIALPAQLSSARDRAAWIRARHPREWVEFKCKVVTDFVAEARAVLKSARPDAELGIYVVPDVDGMTEPLTGQRIADLAPLVDWVSPMLYHNILLRPPSWVGSRLDEVARIAGSKTLPVMQADSNRDDPAGADWGPPMSVADWQAALAEISARGDLPGLIIFPGMSLMSHGRGEALRAILSSRT